jgi:succinyl-diaminopimelate desuccinylase
MQHFSIALSEKLINFPSITPADAGIIDFLISILEPIGFKCHKLAFSEENHPEVINLYARYGTSSPNLCFAGHTDVVPVGDLKAWATDPFKATIIDNKLYGRGAVDMKPAVAAFIAAIKEVLENLDGFDGSLSLLITGDEEASAVNGTVKVLKWLKENNEKIDACIVGEPTNPERLGEMIKIGRRGSISYKLTVNGIQGHVAYPHLADNPITKLIDILKLIKQPLDKGTKEFQPSNLEITNIDVGNTATNVIPNQANANINIRFNNLHTAESLTSFIKDQCNKITSNYHLEILSLSDSFLTKDEFLSKIVTEAVKEVTNLTPELSTTGGTSDARFIKNYCPVIECGLINKTAHKVNEHVEVNDIINLSRIYRNAIEKFFKQG